MGAARTYNNYSIFYDIELFYLLSTAERVFTLKLGCYTGALSTIHYSPTIFMLQNLSFEY